MKAREALQELADKVKSVILERLRSPIGINRAAGKNTLIGSNLEKSIDLYVSDEDEIVFKIADYFSFPFGGRKAGLTPRGQKVYEAIKDWVERKDIRLGNLTKTQIIWIVLRKLKYSDIAPRPVLNPDYDYTKDASQVIPFLDTLFDKWADDTFNALMDELVINK